MARKVNTLRLGAFVLCALVITLGAIALFVLAWVLLTSTAFLIPVAIWLAVRWCLLAPVVELEGRGGVAALRRSAGLVHGRWIRVGSLVGVSAGVALIAGPLLGVALIFLTEMPLALLNIVAGIVYGSMALLADGLHMASHATALAISVVAYVYARRFARDERFAFGTGKVNSLAGYTGAVLLALFAILRVVAKVS